MGYVFEAIVAVAEIIEQTRLRLASLVVGHALLRIGFEELGVGSGGLGVMVVCVETVGLAGGLPASPEAPGGPPVGGGINRSKAKGEKCKE